MLIHSCHFLKIFIKRGHSEVNIERSEYHFNFEFLFENYEDQDTYIYACVYLHTLYIYVSLYLYI